MAVRVAGPFFKKSARVFFWNSDSDSSTGAEGGRTGDGAGVTRGAAGAAGGATAGGSAGAAGGWAVGRAGPEKSSLTTSSSSAGVQLDFKMALSAMAMAAVCSGSLL